MGSYDLDLARAWIPLLAGVLLLDGLVLLLAPWLGLPSLDLLPASVTVLAGLLLTAALVDLLLRGTNGALIALAAVLIAFGLGRMIASPLDGLPTGAPVVLPLGPLGWLLLVAPIAVLAVSGPSMFGLGLATGLGAIVYGTNALVLEGGVDAAWRLVLQGAGLVGLASVMLWEHASGARLPSAHRLGPLAPDSLVVLGLVALAIGWMGSTDAGEGLLGAHIGSIGLAALVLAAVLAGPSQALRPALLAGILLAGVLLLVPCTDQVDAQAEPSPGEPTQERLIGLMASGPLDRSTGPGEAGLSCPWWGGALALALDLGVLGLAVYRPRSG